MTILLILKSSLKKMRNDWIKLKLKDYCVKVTDGTHDSPKLTLDGKYLVTSKHIIQGKVNFSSAYKISESDFNKANSRSKVDLWDILLSMIGTVGEVAIVDQVPNFAIKNVGLFKCGEEIKAKWLFYYLKSPEGRNQIKSKLSGTTQQYITLDELRNYEILVPPDTIQKHFIGILSSLDNKIELLREQNKTLEATAQAIFKEWFVNFNFPNTLNKPYKTAGGKFVESDLGIIPDGWTVSVLKDFISEIIPGEWGKKNIDTTYKNEVLCLRGTDLPDIENGSEIRAPIRFVNDAKLLKSEIKSGDLITEISGGTVGQSTGRVVYINKEIVDRIGNRLVSSNFCRVIRLKDSKQQSFIYLYWRMLYDNGIIFSFENGTTGIKNLDLKSFLNFKIVIPNNAIIKSFCNSVDIIFSKIQVNSAQIKTLSKIRDTLLPKLISGELQLKDYSN